MAGWGEAMAGGGRASRARGGIGRRGGRLHQGGRAWSAVLDAVDLGIGAGAWEGEAAASGG
jgi:hypothetical protein